MTRVWRKLHNEELKCLYSSPNIIRVINQEWAGLGTLHVWDRGEVHTDFWWGNLRKREHSENPGLGEDNIKMDLQEVGGTAWTGLI